MAGGLLALLDDVAALVKMTAASLDDIAAQVGKTTSKVTGVVIDDAAVTPKYVVGLDPKRELAIIWNIAKASMLNKVLFLAPAALVLGFIAPWIITPILMIGGGYLCFEGFEKVHHMFFHKKHDEAVAAGDVQEMTPEELEKERTAGAIRTDFILSAEIMAISYATVAASAIPIQIAVMFAVAVGITVMVYGFVAIVVKADDVGLYLAQNARTGFGKQFGRGLVKSMPPFLKGLGYIGTAAMLWVGAGIIAHGIPAIEHFLHDLTKGLNVLPAGEGIATIALLIVGGLAIGFVIAQIVKLVMKVRGKASAH